MKALYILVIIVNIGCQQYSKNRKNSISTEIKKIDANILEINFVDVDSLSQLVLKSASCKEEFSRVNLPYFWDKVFFYELYQLFRDGKKFYVITIGRTSFLHGYAHELVDVLILNESDWSLVKGVYSLNVLAINEQKYTDNLKINLYIVENQLKLELAICSGYSYYPIYSLDKLNIENK